MRNREIDRTQASSPSNIRPSASWLAWAVAFWGVNYLVWLACYARYSTITGPAAAIMLAPLLTLLFLAATTCPLTAIVFAVDRLVLAKRRGWIADLALVALVAVPALVALRNPRPFQGPTDFEVELVTQVIFGALVVYLNRRTQRRVAPSA